MAALSLDGSIQAVGPSKEEEHLVGPTKDDLESASKGRLAESCGHCVDAVKEHR